MKGFDGVRGDMKHFHNVEVRFFFFSSSSKSSNVWVLSVKLCKDSSLNGCIWLVKTPVFLPENVLTGSHCGGCKYCTRFTKVILHKRNFTHNSFKANVLCFPHEI